MPRKKLYRGDCRDVLKERLEANSVDSVVTDCPYELGFMGKHWDQAGVSFDPRTWKRHLRVLKPGGYLLAFGGSRTYHRIAVAIEDAGFEIRDCIVWMYGSGFPKSHDISKAIDKEDASHTRRERQLKFTRWMRKTGLNHKQINRITQTKDMARHYLAEDQPAVATREHFEKLRPYIKIPVPDWVEKLVDERTVESENFKKREVVGERKGAQSNSTGRYGGWGNDEEGLGISNFKLTNPHTPEAEFWNGWGTALKPAMEPIIVARKPLSEKTVAKNVLRWGTGGLNIDGCRIGTEQVENGRANRGLNKSWQGGDFGDTEKRFSTGRFPANVILDEDAGRMLDKMSGETKGSNYSGPKERLRKGHKLNACVGRSNAPDNYGDSGGASRFFYCAKASKAEREIGCEHFPKKEVYRKGHGNQEEDDVTKRFRTMIRNDHPTVKPLSLMRYLCRLVTPVGGTVLDGFMGSGTTGMAALLEGFGFIGIEAEREFYSLAKARIGHVYEIMEFIEWASEVTKNGRS